MIPHCSAEREELAVLVVANGCGLRTLTNKGERPNEENSFECLGGGNADGARYSTVIGGLLLPSLLA
jgi:hypothetical protein